MNNKKTNQYILDRRVVYEKILLNLLGYKVALSSDIKRWTIYDELDNEVGYIQYKKIHKGDKKSGIEPVYGFITKINSDKYVYGSIREDNNMNNVLEPFYQLGVKKPSGKTASLLIKYGRAPEIFLLDPEDGNILFRNDYRGFYLNFHDKTENFNIEHLLSYEFIPGTTENYLYEIKYAKKDKNFHLPENVTIRGIGGTIADFSGEKIYLTEKAYKNGRLTKHNVSKCDASVIDLIEKNEMGIDAFNRFRTLLNDRLDFKKDLFLDVIRASGHNEVLIPFVKEVKLYYDSVNKEARCLSKH